MSRHFYDIGEILDSDYGKEALQNTALFESIIEHRKILTPMKTTNYENITLKDLDIIPPKEQLENYRSDYKEMQSSMIHGASISFDAILNKILNGLRGL